MPTRIALFPLGTVLFPGAILPMHLFEPRYLKLMEERGGDDPIFGIVLTKAGREVGDQALIHDVGTAATLITGMQHEDGRWSIAVRGGRRFRVTHSDWSRDYLTADIEWLPELSGNLDSIEEYGQQAVELLRSYVLDVAKLTGESGQIESLEEKLREAVPDEPIAAGHIIASMLPLNTWERQALLETEPASDRLALLVRSLKREIRRVRETGALGPIERHTPTGFSLN